MFSAFAWISLLLAGSAAGLVVARDAVISHQLPSYELPPQISQNLGPYSARYSVESFGDHPPIPGRDLPDGCSVTQVNILQRHGARFPTAGQGKTLTKTLDKVRRAVISQNPEAIRNTSLAFLGDWNFPYGAETLVDFGREEAYTSGVQIAEAYGSLTRRDGDGKGMFVRSTSKGRVLEQARWFLHGFHGRAYPAALDTLELPDVIIPIDSSFNNTLSCKTCAGKTPRTKIDFDLKKDEPTAKWLAKYAPPIVARLNGFLPTAKLTTKDVRYLMSICAFETAYLDGKASPWCGVFTDEEWAQNEYWYDLQKYWEKAYGSTLGRASGSGWVTELIARLTETPVQGSGCVNRTMDLDPTSFPVLPPNAPRIFADFSSDDNIAGMIAALGILRDAEPLPAEGPPPPNRLWVTSKIVPFAANLVVERLSCRNDLTPMATSAVSTWEQRPEDSDARLVESDLLTTTGHSYDGKERSYVRMVLNDAIVPLTFEECGELGSAKGMCELNAFVRTQSFSTGGGDWEKVCSNAEPLDATFMRWQ